MSARTPMKRPTNRTAKAIAAAIGRSRSTIVRHIAQPRADYEANSLNRTKPWEALGVSRSTWYRHRNKSAA